jgi:hypothetical protein
MLDSQSSELKDLIEIISDLFSESTIGVSALS